MLPREADRPILTNLLVTKAAPKIRRAESILDKTLWSSALQSWFHFLAAMYCKAAALDFPSLGESLQGKSPVDPFYHYCIKVFIFHPKVC